MSEEIRTLELIEGTVEDNIREFFCPMSEEIKNRLLKKGLSYSANDNISEVFFPGELEELEDEVAEKFQGVLESLVIDTARDHNTKDTARRVAKMYLHEIYKGRYYPEPKVTDFPNAKHLDELYILGPITVRSTCSHHFAPIFGTLTVGVLPSERVIGISKFARIADWVMSRPHIQEEAIIMLADKLEEIMKPKGLAVVVNAEHFCMKMRGVKESNCSMTNSVMRGLMHDDSVLRGEFLQLVRGYHK